MISRKFPWKFPGNFLENGNGVENVFPGNFQGNFPIFSFPIFSFPTFTTGTTWEMKNWKFFQGNFLGNFLGKNWKSQNL